MENKKALELVNGLLEELKKSETSVQSQIEDLKKSNAEVKATLEKVDPKSRLPGVMLDKGSVSGNHPFSKDPKTQPSRPKGVHTSYPTLGESGAGMGARSHKEFKTGAPKYAHLSPKDREQNAHRNKQFAVDQHKKVINELKAMPKPNLPKSEDGNLQKGIVRDIGHILRHEWDIPVAGALAASGIAGLLNTNNGNTDKIDNQTPKTKQESHAQSATDSQKKALSKLPKLKMPQIGDSIKKADKEASKVYQPATMTGYEDAQVPVNKNDDPKMAAKCDLAKRLKKALTGV